MNTSVIQLEYSGASVCMGYSVCRLQSACTSCSELSGGLGGSPDGTRICALRRGFKPGGGAVLKRQSCDRMVHPGQLPMKGVLVMTMWVSRNNNTVCR